MNVRTLLRAVPTALFAAGLLSGCGSEKPITREYLDPQTAVTVRTVATPYIFAHEVPELAANVRDYLSVGAVELNNMGGRTHYLALIVWSTVDRERVGVPQPALPEGLRITIGSQVRELTAATHEPRSIGIGAPVFRPPTGYRGESWYAVTPADLRALVTTPPATLELLDDQHPATYALWRDAAAALADFVRDIPDTITPENKRPR